MLFQLLYAFIFYIYSKINLTESGISSYIECEEMIIYIMMPPVGSVWT